MGACIFEQAGKPNVAVALHTCESMDNCKLSGIVLQGL